MGVPNTIVLESFLELDEAQVCDPGWFWGNIIQRQSLTIVHAGPKRAKTFFSQNFALSFAGAFPTFLDIPVFGPGRVVIFQREVHRWGMQERLRKQLEHAPFPVANRRELLARISHNLSRAVRLHDVRTFRDFRLLLQDTQPDYVILDPLAHVLVEDENDNAAVGRSLENIAELRDDPGCGVMVIHHNRKESEANKGVEPSQNARGADRIIADADTIISLVRGRKDPRGPVARFHVTARNSEGVEPFSALFNKRTAWWERSAERGDLDRIAGWLTAGPLATEALVKLIEGEWGLHDPRHHRSAQTYLDRACEAGVLVRVGDAYARKQEVAK